MGLFDDIKAEPAASAPAGLFDDIPVAAAAAAQVDVPAVDVMGNATGGAESAPAPPPAAIAAAPPPAKTAKPAAPSALNTMARSAVQGLTFGLGDESYGLTQGVKGLFNGEGFGAGYSRGVDEFRGNEKAGRAENPVAGLVGEVGGGMATGLGAARAGLTLMQKGMSLPQMLGTGLAEGGLYGGAYGAGNAEGGLGQRAQGLKDGAIVGAGVGVAVPAVARGLGAATRIVSPMVIAPERQAFADILRSEGVNLTAGQRSGSTPLRYAESILGDAPLAGGQSSGAMTRQAEEFTSAALKRIGETGRATPEIMDRAGQRLSATFEDLSARNTMVADPKLGTDINTVLQRYGRKLPSEQKALVGNEAVEIIQRLQANGGTLPGREYQVIRSDLSRRGNAAMGTDSEYGRALKGLRDALDNTMARSVSPEDAAAWKEVNRQYRNYKDLINAVGGAGANAAEGLISPQALRSAAASGRNKEAYVRGQGDFADLIRAGNVMMTPMPNSGTAQRMTIGSGITGLGGALAGNGHLLPAAAAAVGPGLAGRALYSSPVQQWLGNQALGAASREEFEAVMRRLLQGGGESQSRELLPAR